MKSQRRRARLKAANGRQVDKRRLAPLAPGPLPNYSLSSVCPACASKTYKQACKVRCPRCGFMWDCSEL